MNKKLIAVAVAGVVAAPAAYADISAYGRIHNVIALSDDGTTESQEMQSGSRFGFKGSGDIGNGMSAFAQYEFSTNTDNSADGVTGTRIGLVGLSGPFGSISLGQQWSAYYENFGTYASLNIWGGPKQALGPARTGNTIQYSNSFGPISLALDTRIDDNGDGGGNGFGLGATLSPMDNITLSGVYDTNDTTNKDTMGVVATLGFGALSFTAAHEQQDEGMMEHKNTVLGVGFSVTDQLSMRVALSETEMEGASGVTETDRANASATYVIGGGLRTYIEFSNSDNGTTDADLVAIGLRMDF